jgi:hypothetical protein
MSDKDMPFMKLRVALSLFMLTLAITVHCLGQSAKQTNTHRKFLGTLSANPYDPKSTSNPYGPYGSKYSPDSINNPYGKYGSPYSPYSVHNPYTNQAPKIYSRDGTYLGRLSDNKYDPESVSNPYGLYGSKYSPNSINNPFGKYGSVYSPLSPSNPYSNQGPVIKSGDASPQLGIPRILTPTRALQRWIGWPLRLKSWRP